MQNLHDTLNDSVHLRNLYNGISQLDALLISDNSEESYFIDRDPEVFGDIMHYLQTWKISSTNKSYLEILQSEALFFGFNNMAKRIEVILGQGLIMDEVLDNTYQSRNPEYFEINCNTSTSDYSSCKALVKIYRFKNYLDEFETKIIIKDTHTTKTEND